jgi:UDP-2,3-diacylglucosamine pyrophosphatase LpxH
MIELGILEWTMQSTARLRAVWISDVHLGSRDCHVDMLLAFLRSVRCETLYLVGDIIDVERMRSSFYWPESHSRVLRTILDMSMDGTRVVYIPGNHDDDFRGLAGQMLGPVEVVERHVHNTLDGRRLLVLHGDEFDTVIKSRSLANIVSCWAYGGLLALNRLVHRWHTLLGRPYWSLAQHVKGRLGKAVRYVENYQRACIRAARELEMDGVVCGHIHRAAIVDEDGVSYYNTGDWVESCTAITEDSTGRIELLQWAQAASAETAAERWPVRDAA